MNRPNAGFVLTMAAILMASSADQSRAEDQSNDAPAVKFPSPDEVASIDIEAHERFPGGPFEITLTKPEEIEPIIKWLKGVDWDPAKSKDARIIRVAPAAQVEIKPRKGKAQSLLFSDALVIVGDRYWPVETKQFAEVVKQVRSKDK